MSFAIFLHKKKLQSKFTDNIRVCCNPTATSVLNSSVPAIPLTCASLHSPKNSLTKFGKIERKSLYKHYVVQNFKTIYYILIDTINEISNAVKAFFRKHVNLLRNICFEEWFKIINNS